MKICIFIYNFHKESQLTDEIGFASTRVWEWLVGGCGGSGGRLFEKVGGISGP